MKSIQEIEKFLMGECVVEGMSDEVDLTLEEMPEYSEDEGLSQFQALFTDSCITAKKFLVADVIMPDNPAGYHAFAIKQMMNDYINIPSNANNQAMKHFYNNDSLETVAYQIATLTFAFLLQNADDIRDIPRETMRMFLDPHSVSTTMGIYVLFALAVNDNFDKPMFNELFINAWFVYYKNFHSRLFMFKMNGNNWNIPFKGAFLIN